MPLKKKPGQIQSGVDRHAIIVDRLIQDFDEVTSWIEAHDGKVEAADYRSSYGRAVVVSFAGDFATAEHVFQLPGFRRALIAYWSEALVDLHERSAKSVFGRFHDFNAVAEIVRRIENRPIW